MAATSQVLSSSVPARILVVEDEPIVAMDLSLQLQQLGYEVCGTEDNGQSAIAAARNARPDIVLMDIVIKGDMDGIDTAKHIGRGLNIPVIFLTAFSDQKTVERAAQVAPYGFLTKPFQIKELRAGIEVALYKANLERHLRESELWFASTLRCVGDGVIATDSAGHVRFMNRAAEAMTEWEFDDARGRVAADIFLLHDAKTDALVASPLKRALLENTVIDLEYGTLLATRSGKRLAIDDSAAPIRTDDGQVLGAVIVFRDVSERIKAEQSLRESEQRFRNTFDFAPIGMAVISLERHFLQVNTAVCALLESSVEELLGASDHRFTNAEDQKVEQDNLLRLLSGNIPTVQFEKRFRCKSGKEIWTLVSVSVLRARDAPLCYLYQIHDLTEQKATQYQLARLAHFDTLTGLANRARLRYEIERMIQQARRYQGRIGVVFIDLDHFKEVNDTLGHEAGDNLLQTVARRLNESVRATDCVARLGGDEFVLLLPEVRSSDEIAMILGKIQTLLVESIDIAGYEAQIGASFGVSLYPDDGEEPTILFRCADSALYHAKAEGRNNVQFYRPELTARVEQRLSIANALRHALERNQLILHYQPIMALSPSTIVGAEALLRWNHPERGLLAPDVFIPIAEETGLIVSIGEWVIDTACREAALWLQAGTPLRIAVNVSSRQFKSPELVQVVASALKTANLPPQLLCLEITEQLLMQDTERNMSVINNLKALGVQIAIDDFGVGYSSLSYLTRFAPNIVKIDRSFINEIVHGRSDAVIVKAVIAMAHSLNMQVVAEGIETSEQNTFLLGHQCDYGQGYLFSKPKPADDFRQASIQNMRS